MARTMMSWPRRRGGLLAHVRRPMRPHPLRPQKVLAAVGAQAASL